MYDIKALYEADSVEDAVRLRLKYPEAQIIAGGSDVLVQVREGKRAGKELISIYGIDSMRGVCYEEDGALRREFDELYSAVFPSADTYIDVVRLLANHKNGLTRKETYECSWRSSRYDWRAADS